MKKPFLGLGLAAMSAMLLAGCAGSPKAEMTGCYSISDYSAIAAMGWTIETNYELALYSDSTYRLEVVTDIFGGAAEGSELPGGAVAETKGKRTVITTGSYTSVANADYDVQLDLTLNNADWVYVAQYGKAWGRNTDILGATTMLDTNNWTEAMETIYGDTDDEGNALNNGRAKLLASDHAAKKTCTIENPSLNPEDTTAAYRLVTIPTVVAA